MKLEQLIDQFELITDTEEGITQLRKIILNLAFQGKLTKQLPKDEDAKKLAWRIKEEKQQLYESGEIRKPKDLGPISENEKKYKLPENWKWSKIGNSYYIEMGQSPPSKYYNTEGEGLPFYQGKSEFRDMYPKPEKWCSKPNKIAYKGDVLISVRAPVGPTNICQEESCIGRGLAAIRPLCGVWTMYTIYCIRTFDERLSRQGSGSTFKAITKKDLLNFCLPLPPKEEQQRIVQKIETLFSRVDELEQKVQKDKEIDERLQLAVLDDLQSAETPEASRQSWQRLTDHFEQIYRKPEHIDQLKQAILNEAVRGRLVRQSADPNNEPSEKLLERIKEEKQRLYEEGEIRKPKVLDPVSNEEVPFGLPRNWQWVRLGNICQLITDGAHHTPNYIEDGVRFISVKNISSGEIDFKDCKYISKEEHEKLCQRCNPERGDILLTKVGTTGIPVVVETDIEFSIFVSVSLLKINTDFVNPHFLKYLIQSPLVYSQSLENTRGVGNQNLVLRDINNFTIPFMPYKDQIKLTEEIERYFTWCDDLKEKLIHSRQIDQQLLEALVNEIPKSQQVDLDGKS